ncbi:MAG TPA: FAD-binding oxidoreductase, partial [Nordella sp.]|nr:FAD-binding oxidoreductase [Nordella sp.]
ILLRRHAMQHFARWEAAGLRFNHIGYLRLARTAAQMALFEQSIRMQAEAGFRAKLYRTDELHQLVPHLDVTDLAGGIFGPDNGFLDPHELCMFLAERLKASHGKIHQYCTVERVTRQSGGYRLQTTKGPFDGDVVVNAAGAWAPKIAEMLGQTLHVRSERHEAVLVLLDRPLDYTMPMVMDLVNGEGTGLNFRHEKEGELIAEIHKVEATEAEDPDAYNEQCDEASKIHLAELLLERLPLLPEARLGRGWAGLYPVTADHRPFVGLVDADEPGFVTAAGAGGYGIQLSPVIGRIAADWALHGAPVSTPGLESLAPSAARNVANL